jgi:hypothetical protein
MTNANWGLLDPNAFGRGYQQTNAMVTGVAEAFQQGQAQRRQMDGQNALTAYAMNPDDPAAFQGLAQHHPQAAMQVRERQRAAQSAKHEQDTKLIAALARDTKDPMSFDAAVDQVVAMGYPDAAQFKGKFSPGLRSALMAAGGLKDEAGPQPSIQREVEYYKSIGRTDLADQLLQRHAEGSPIVANNGDGTFTIVPRGMVGQPQGGAPHEGPLPPPPPGFVIDDGGPASQAPGGFR